MIQITQDNSNNELKLDGILKELFKISKPVIIDMLNSLFNENISHNAEISYEDKEYIKPNEMFGKIYADMLIKVTDNKKITRYHMEYQTKRDDIMAIRMFEYGYYVAKQEAKLNRNKTVLRFPNQRVIYIEEDRSVDDYEEMTVMFADGQAVTIKVPILKYWKYDINDLKEKNLEALLPLQIFKFRKIFDRIVKSKSAQVKKEELVSEKYILFRNLLIETVAEINKFYEEKKLCGYDIGVMQSALGELWEYFKNRYAEIEGFKKEDFGMVINKKYDPDYMLAKGRAEGKAEGKVEGKVEAITELILDYINIKFGVTPEEYEEKLNRADKIQLKEISKKIFTLNSVEEINEWLKSEYK